MSVSHKDEQTCVYHGKQRQTLEHVARTKGRKCRTDLHVMSSALSDLTVRLMHGNTPHVRDKACRVFAQREPPQIVYARFAEKMRVKASTIVSIPMVRDERFRLKEHRKTDKSDDLSRSLEPVETHTRPLSYNSHPG